MKVVDEKRLENIKDVGRNLGAQFMHNAIDMATHPEQASDQLMTLRYLAIHILATEALNGEKHNLIGIDDYLKELKAEVTEEFEMLMSDNILKPFPKVLQ